MDYNNNEPDFNNNSVNNNNASGTTQPNGMATAALVLGILSIVSICCVYGAYVLGGIAITLALLSRGKNHKLSTNALIGTILSIVSMVISTVIIVFFIISGFYTYGSVDNFMKQYESYYEEIYGEDFPFSNDYYNNDSNYYEYHDDDSQPVPTELPNTL